MSTIQGNFLSGSIQNEIKIFLRDCERSRSRRSNADIEDLIGAEQRVEDTASMDSPSMKVRPSFSGTEIDSIEEKRVDVILSDMCEPWAQTDGFYKRSLSDPYYRMMNTSGMNFRDHAGSMVRSPVRR